MKEKELAEFLDFISALKDKADLLQKLRDVDIELEQIKWRNKKLELLKRTWRIPPERSQLFILCERNRVD